MNQNLPAAVAETHTGTVFFNGDRAYKLKKPVVNGFLDFRTLAARKAACDREVELNRRFAPDVYLGVADVTDVDGTICDHLIVMRRLDPELRLPTRIRHGDLVSEPLRMIARTLAVWHARAPRGPEISAQGGRDALRGRWTDNFTESRAYDIPGAAEIEHLALRFLDARADLFARRIDEGRIVDGHGDLTADDVFLLPDGPRILDCLEFSDALRHLDGLDDAAFLAMDLERLHAPEHARRFLDWYTEFSGDPAPASLRHHYIAYRAFVRAKVACMRLAQGDPRATPLIALYADIALRHLRAGTVTLTLVGGLPGTGKTTLSGALADRLGSVLLSTDRLRKESAGLPAEQSAAAGFGQGLYTDENTEKAYELLLERAGALLRQGESVILDASWTSDRFRRLAVRTAEGNAADLVQLCCQVPQEISADRIRGRHTGASDADERIAEAMRAHADPWPDAIVIGTASGTKPALEVALKAVHPHGEHHHWPTRPQMEAD